MGKTLLKDTFREIKNTLSRFMAIIAIIALGVSFFVGVKMTGPNMKIMADKYFKDNKLMDFQLLSNIGFNTDDIESIKKVKGVKGIMPSYSIDALIETNNVSAVVKINSLSSGKINIDDDNYINRPLLVSGRLPLKSGECVIEENKFNNINFTIGSKLEVSSGDDTDILENVITKEFIVVGIIKSPLYISQERGTSAIGNGKISSFMSILESDFDMPVYSEIYITAKGGENANTYSDEYDENIKSLKADLKKLGLERAGTRYEEIKSEANKTIGEKEKEYNDGLEKQKNEIAKAQKEIDSNQNRINTGNYELAKKKKAFTKTITDGEAQIKKSETELKDAFNQYNDGLKLFNDSKQQAIASGFYDAQKNVFLAQEETLNGTKAVLDASLKELNIKKAELIAGKNKGYEEFDKNQKKLYASQLSLDGAKKELETSKKDSEKKLAEAKEKLNNAKEDVKKIPDVKWYILGRDTNVGYVDYGYAADRMDSISRVFPLIFILVAMLICFTSINRLVEEQRTYIGILKSLGYNKRSITFKYLIYAILASIIGGIIGIVMGFTVFPSLLINIYSNMYTLPKIFLSFDPLLALMVFIGGILVTTTSAVMASFENLSLNAAQLIIPKAPKPGKLIFLERIQFIWKRMKFTQKVTARNIFRYKSRFFMTVIGVAGCTALLLVGFGLNDSIRSIGTKQFKDIYTYQMKVDIKDNLSVDEENSISKTITESPNYSSKLNLLIKSIDIGYLTKDKSCNIIVPENAKDINNFISLNEKKNRRKN